MNVVKRNKEANEKNAYETLVCQIITYYYYA
jgi:hypothetical protein